MTEEDKIKNTVKDGDYKPEPDKDGAIHSDAEGEVVNVQDGHATPAEATVQKAMERQAEGDAVEKEKASDAAASEDGNKAKAVTDEEREAKIRRAQEARAARAAAAGEGAAGAAAERPARAPRAAKAEEGEEPQKPKEPSKNQPLLDRIKQLIAEQVGAEAIDDAVINDKNNELPTITVKAEYWFRTAEALKLNPELAMSYLRCLSGVDQETHLEVVYQMINLSTKKELCVKVKTDRESPSIPSVTPLWSTADWNEREVYDLFGIDFPGHPDLRRIMMADDWVGHPLRKDYEPLDPEV